MQYARSAYGVPHCRIPVEETKQCETNLHRPIVVTTRLWTIVGCKNCVISLAWKKEKKGAIPFWACRTIGKQWFEPCRKWSRILKTSRKSCNGPFWNVTNHGSKALDSDDALAIYYGSCSEKHAVMRRSTCALIRSNAILHIGCIVATCVKVVMMTPLTVVLCMVCNIGTSTLCAYCIWLVSKRQ